MPQFPSCTVRGIAILGIVGFSLVPARPIVAQTSDRGGERHSLVERAWFHVGVNALMGGAGSLVHAWRTDTPAWPALRGGLAGGFTSGVGMRIMGSETADLRFVGLQVTALGANVSRNAGNGVPLLSDLYFPLLPAWIRVQREASDWRVSARLSAANVSALAYYALGPANVHFDWRGSLVTASPMLTLPEEKLECKERRGKVCTHAVLGQALWGVRVVTTARDAAAVRYVDTHESIHVGQFVRDAALFGIPLSDSLLNDPMGRWGWVVFDHITPIALLSNLGSWASGVNPKHVELEVHSMMRGWSCPFAVDGC